MDANTTNNEQGDFTLEEKTKAFWRLSLSFNGKAAPVTFKHANASITRLLGMLNPYRPLAEQTLGLKEEIVQGRSLHKPTTPAEIAPIASANKH